MSSSPDQPEKKDTLAEGRQPVAKPRVPAPAGDGKSKSSTPDGTSPGTYSSPESRLIPGLGDRLHQFLMQGYAAANANEMLASDKRTILISGLAPTSRVECLRRLSADKFCNPLSPSGCGGEYCGQQKMGLAGGNYI